MGGVESSASWTALLQSVLRYLGIRGVKRVTQEPVRAVTQDGIAFIGDSQAGYYVRTSGTVRGLRAGEQAPVLWSRGLGKAVVPAAILQHQTNRGMMPPPPMMTTQIISGVIEELFAAPISSQDARLDIWFRNDKQITRLGIRPSLPADPDLVKWGQTSDAFFVRVPVESAPSRYYIFTFNRDPSTPIDAAVPIARFLNAITLTTVPICQVSLTGTLTGRDQIPRARFGYHPYGLDLVNNDYVIDGISDHQTFALLDESGQLIGTIFDEYLTALHHLVILVSYTVTIRFPNGTAHWSHIIFAEPDDAFAWDPLDVPFVADQFALLQDGEYRHVALIDATDGLCLWSSTGATLMSVLAGSFQRLYVGDAPAFHLGVEAMTQDGVALNIVTQENDPVFDTLEDIDCRLTATLTGTHALTFLALSTLEQEGVELRRDTVPSSWLATTVLPGDYLQCRIWADDPDEFPPEYVIPPNISIGDHIGGMRLRGALTYTSVVSLRVMAAQLLHSDADDPRNTRLFLSLDRRVGDQSGFAAAYILDGQGTLIRELLAWTPAATTAIFARCAGGSRDHVLWGFSGMSILTAIESGETMMLTETTNNQLATAGARIIRPDVFYATAETERTVLRGWNYTTGALRLDATRSLQPDSRLGRGNHLKDQPMPDPTVLAVTPSYQAAIDPDTLKTLQ